MSKVETIDRVARSEQSAGWAEDAVIENSASHEHGGNGQRSTTEREVLARIESARTRKGRIRDERITLAHGAGGKATHTLIEAMFLENFRNPILETLEDQATLQVRDARLAFTTDSFVVSPLFFPGGNIGDLAVNGTVNDLAVGGARPLYLSAGFILEEGFPVSDLGRIVAAMKVAAENAGVQIVTGDTKVVQKGKGDGCYINTSGVGAIERPVKLSAASCRPGDAVIVSGPIGEHGITIMLARGELEIEADLSSDTAPLNMLVNRILDTAPDTRCMRDATRGGVATVLNEIAAASGVAILIDESAIPIREEVAGACEILGIDPLHVACEGRLVAVVGEHSAHAALDAIRSGPYGEDARIIGRVKPDPAGIVLLKTRFGGTRILDLLIGDPLPRIC
ncbi:MAG: hydrogenase expression/formation protein HypE [Candidatus Binatus sp.]|nr:hydrogenase expression/formation protein HypE [Candidatus Binatus sp.]